jgi:hypothetical protein
MPMDIAAGYGTTNYLANCSEPSYITPYVTNFSAPCASPDDFNSATHFHNAYSRISENSIGAHVPLSNTIACDTPPQQLQNFGNTQVSLPKNIERSEGRSSKEWAKDLVEKVLEAIAMRANHGKKGDSIITVNPAKAGLDNACAESNQEKMIDTSAMTNLAQAELNLSKTKLDTHVEFVEPEDTSFVEKEHGEYEMTVLDFSRCKGAFMLPFEFRAKEVDEHQQEENIPEPPSVEKHQSEVAQDTGKEKDKMLEDHQEVEQDNVQVVQSP